MLWQEKPPFILLLPRFLKYHAILLVVMFICSQIGRYAGSSLQMLKGVLVCEVLHAGIPKYKKEYTAEAPGMNWHFGGG
jgi:hypothetical protein